VSLDHGEGDQDDGADQLRTTMESLGGRARAVNQQRAARLAQALDEVAAGHRSEVRRRDAVEVAHRLIGSAGTFGFSGASRLAGEIERYLRSGEFDDPDRLAAARDQVRRLQETLAAESDYQPEDDERDPTS
jgi:HPt (histidine-containing phosphotransfer) domain-containing protein